MLNPGFPFASDFGMCTMLSQWVAYFREFWQGHYFLKIVWIVSDETAGNLSLNYYF